MMHAGAVDGGGGGTAEGGRRKHTAGQAGGGRAGEGSRRGGRGAGRGWGGTEASANVLGGCGDRARRRSVAQRGAARRSGAGRGGRARAGRRRGAASERLVERATLPLGATPFLCWRARPATPDPPLSRPTRTCRQDGADHLCDGAADLQELALGGGRQGEVESGTAAGGASVRARRARAAAPIPAPRRAPRALKAPKRSNTRPPPNPPPEARSPW
jgi:hypothetical protein